MILTGTQIESEIARGGISIEPFHASQTNPNSYNYRLGPLLKMAVEGEDGRTKFRDLQIPDSGIVLQPHTLYLGHTLEKIGSRDYAMSLIGRSSMGRLGLFLQISANLGHTGSNHQWTLELYACKPIRLHYGMKIGQVSFWSNAGKQHAFERRYALFDKPQESISLTPGPSMPEMKARMS